MTALGQDSLIALLERTIGCTGITEASEMGEIWAWDSFRHFAVILAVEKHYQLSIPRNLIGRLTSVSEIRSYLERAGKLPMRTESH